MSFYQKKENYDRKSQACMILAEIKVELQSFWSCSGNGEEVLLYTSIFFAIFIYQESIRKNWFTFCYLYEFIKKILKKNPKYKMSNSYTKKKIQGK